MSSDDFLSNILVNTFSINSDKVLRKAKELKRLIAAKNVSSGALTNLTETCIAVYCVDLACRDAGTAFDQSKALKVCNLTKFKYLSGLNTLEKLLGLDQSWNINKMCLKTNALKVEHTAMKIHELWKSKEKDSIGRTGLDPYHPTYLCAAIWAAARIQSTTIHLPTLMQSARSRKLDAERLMKTMKDLFENSGQLKSTSKSPGKVESESASPKSQPATDQKSETKPKPEPEPVEEEFEPYEQWKDRLLRQAGVLV